MHAASDGKHFGAEITLYFDFDVQCGRLLILLSVSFILNLFLDILLWHHGVAKCMYSPSSIHCQKGQQLMTGCSR